MIKSVLENIADELRATREEFAASMDEPLHCEGLDASELIERADDAIGKSPERDVRGLLVQLASVLFNHVCNNPAIGSPSARHFASRALEEIERTDPPEMGSEWAQELGCTCHAPSVGYLNVSPPEVRRNPYCPMHGRDPDAERERQIERGQR